MLKSLDPIRVLHLEPTDVCQAACPLCARETDSTFDKETKHHLTLDQLKGIMTQYDLTQLDKVFMCGNYGDPAAGLHTQEIYSYLRSVDPTITLGMNTNGGLQNIQWWGRLAAILNQPKDYVVFSIDGLEDTNHIYRRNVDWKKLMSNVNSFIQHGGSAHWDMLVYEHNEHQVDECEQLARSMGFKWFRAKVSKRPSTISWLKPPKNWRNPIITNGSVNCHALNEQSRYVSAQGYIHPCCWLGNSETIDNFEDIKSSWDTESCNPMCKKICTSINQDSSFTNQWQRSVQL